MGLFRKKDKVIDLTKYKKQQEKLSEIKKESSQDTNLSFLGNLASSSTSQQSDFDVSEPDERKRKIVKRFMETTNRIEELSNQLYHLQQRIELLERKIGLKSFE